MKTFQQLIGEEVKKEEAKPDAKMATAMRNFVYHAVLKTDKAHDEIKKAFVSKFGANNLKTFEKHVASIVD